MEIAPHDRYMNIFRLSVLFVLIVLSGCETPEHADTQKIDTQFEDNAARLEKAAENAKISCQNKRACDKAFKLAWTFVKENADTTIRFYDDTTVDTFIPIAWGKMGLSATITPATGGSATIQLLANCKGVNKKVNDAIYKKCVEKVENTYLKFKPYIESGLQ
jgi:hypothetical protein